MPVWFVSWPVLSTAIVDGTLTIGELAALPSLTVGTATFYEETLHPLGANKVAKIEFNARGTLTDGRSFQVAVSGNTGVGRVTHIGIKFG